MLHAFSDFHHTNKTERKSMQYAQKTDNGLSMCSHKQPYKIYKIILKYMLSLCLRTLGLRCIEGLEEN